MVSMFVLMSPFVVAPGTRGYDVNRRGLTAVYEEGGRAVGTRQGDRLDFVGAGRVAPGLPKYEKREVARPRCRYSLEAP